MNLRQLRYFCEVVEAGSAALAAKRLFVAPTVGAQLILTHGFHLNLTHPKTA
ncbi:LysR family transcriptional regulator [Ralstonia holmesii]|uniref:LysR family transcriptional regulator n=1 Tax=Ralstonia holmesii TaxID=3058602 RepID=UPI003D6463F9